MKYRKPFWLTVLALAAAGLLAALAAVLVQALRGTLLLIPAVTLALCAAGCGAVGYFALRAIRALPAQEAPTGPKKQREQALAAQSALRLQIDRNFSKSLSLFVLLVCAVVFLLAYAKAQQTPSIPQSSVHSGISFERGEVVSVDGGIWRGDQEVEDVPVGKQEVTVRITSGEHAGESYQLDNNLSYLYGTVLEAGDSVTVSFSVTDGKVDGITLQDYDRTSPLLWIVILFLAITILIGGKVGAKSLLGLGLTILCLFTVLIPLLLGGAPTLPTVLGLCAFVTVVEFVILGGVNRKTVCAIFGTVAGVALAMLFGLLACSLLRVNGFQMYVAEPSVEALLQIKQGQLISGLPSLQIGDLLVGGILIAALGAVNDVAMSIRSAMNELIAVNPGLTRRELFRSGMNIGRDMVGTMTNTLILALVGGSFVMIIYLTSLEPSFPQLMSSAYFSVELVQALASSAGVILAVPLSVAAGTALFAGRRKHG